MAAFEELKAQRDFLMGNKWVRGTPKGEGEACLEWRIDPTVEGFEYTYGTLIYLHPSTRMLLAEVLPESIGTPWFWNDSECQSAGEAIAVLEEAMRVAKERGLTDEA